MPISPKPPFFQTFFQTRRHCTPHQTRRHCTPHQTRRPNPTPFLAPRSNSWTFKQLFGPIPYVKVQPLDLQATFRPHSLRQGPTPGPSSNFSAPFLAPRSNPWTFKQLFGPIPDVKVQLPDLQASFQHHSLRQGPTPGPSSIFSAPFLTSRSNPWTFRQVFDTIPHVKVQPLDLQASFRHHSSRQGPTPGPSGKFLDCGRWEEWQITIWQSTTCRKFLVQKKRTRNVCKTLCIRWLAITSNQLAWLKERQHPNQLAWLKEQQQPN